MAQTARLNGYVSLPGGTAQGTVDTIVATVQADIDARPHITAEIRQRTRPDEVRLVFDATYTTTARRNACYTALSGRVGAALAGVTVRGRVSRHECPHALGESVGLNCVRAASSAFAEVRG